MACPTVISVDQLTHYLPSQVGLRALDFGKLFLQDVPLPPLFCIPQESLQLVVRENKLDTKLAQVRAQYDLHEITSLHQYKIAMANEIKKQQLPTWFTQEVLAVYHRVFHTSFVKLLPGEKFAHFDETKFEHIQGDANLIESILACWAESIIARSSQSVNSPDIQLVPSSLILQAQYQPIVSGTVRTDSGMDGSKTQVTLTAIWGAPDKDLLENQADHFSIDIRTWHVIHRDIAVKRKQYQRTSDRTAILAVPFQYHQHPSLTDEQAVSIAQVAVTIKQHRLTPQVVMWELTKEGLFVTGVESSGELTSVPARALKKTITKLYISTGNPYKQLHLSPLVDGIGVLRSEYTLAKFGIHPQHVIHSQQKHLLEKELVATIKAYQESLSKKPILYRSQNFNSAELRQLKYSENYEPHEPNPYLGYRGGLQLQRQPELLAFELSVLRQVLQTSTSPVGYLLSFIRTPSELEFILQEITAAGLFTVPHFSVWLQLNTPDNVLNLRSYPTQKLAGLSVNVKSIQALLLGIDPDNTEIYEHYVLETQSTLKLIREVAETVKELHVVRSTGIPLHLQLHLEDFAHELVAEAVKLGYHGVVVKPSVVQLAHESIVDLEVARLERGK